jgi:hypothetical protein
MNVIETKVSRAESDATGIELSLFQNLKSIVRNKNYESVDTGQDNIFWSIKLYTEDLIKESGEGKTIAYSLLESFAFAHFVDRAKDKSTLKAKCRSIWNWYNARNWTIPKRSERTMEETKMTRIENMKKINVDKVEKNYRAVVNILTGLFNEEYKKKSGAWHIGKIATQLNLNRDTVSKYIKEYEKQNPGEKL